MSVLCLFTLGNKMKYRKTLCLKDYAFAPDHDKYFIGLIPVR